MSSAPGVGRAFSLPRKKSWTRRTTERCRVSGGQVSEMTARGKRSFPEPRLLPPDPVPSGREVIERVTTLTGEWQLQRAGSHFEIICNGVFLMASYNQPSDRALAALALRRVIGEGLRVLVGGLGIGYTAQAALEDSRVGRLEVVEIEPVVVVWHRAHFAGLCSRPLEDPRTRLIVSDVCDVPLPPQSYDAILLDTDNGPDWLIRQANTRLYGQQGLMGFLAALRPGGVLAYWSAGPAPRLAKTLASVGASVDAVEVEDQIGPDRRGTAWLYLATKATAHRSPAPGAE